MTYHTEQEAVLLAFLSAHCQESFTAPELDAALGDCPNRPSRSTLYRLLPKLAAEGKLRRFSEEGNRVRYQLVAGAHCQHHLHLKCTACGRILHMSEEASEEVLRQIFQDDRFSVDREQTILFGRCAQCGRKP